MTLDKNSLIKKLNLKPLEPEGGFFDRTYISEQGHGSAIYYLIDQNNFSQLHRLKCDEIFHFYAGDEVEMAIFSESKDLIVKTLGPPTTENHECQVWVPSNTWQGLRLKNSDGWALLGTTCFPAFSFDLFELGNKETLLAQFPEYFEIIHRYLK